MRVRVCCPSCGGNDAELTPIESTGVLFCPSCALVCDQPFIPWGRVRFDLPEAPTSIVLNDAGRGV